MLLIQIQLNKLLKNSVNTFRVQKDTVLHHRPYACHVKQFGRIPRENA